jgi:small conductance mechanosensitive channel
MNIDRIIEQGQVLGLDYGQRVIEAILIFVVGKFAVAISKKVIVKLMKKSKQDETLIAFVASISGVGLLAFVVVAALGQLGIQTASFVAIIGAAGLAIGLALQGSLSNFASGVLLIIFKPFKLDNYIEGAGIAGVVEEIGIFTTTLKSPDNKRIIVPNSKLTSDNIVNYSANLSRRVDMLATVSYSDDIDKVKAILKSILDANPNVLKEPAALIAVKELADSSVNLVVRPWVNTADYWDVYFETQEAIKKEFDKADISIPFPQQDVHIHNVNS